MHAEAAEFVRAAAAVIPVLPDLVLEVGSLNVNGTARDAFPGSFWVGVDSRPGNGVSMDVDAFALPVRPLFDLVVCCEVLEHVEDVAGLVGRLVGWAVPGGHVVITCAGPGRTPHGVNGADVGTEWYRNVEPAELRATEGVEWLLFEFHRSRGDLYALGRKR